MKLDQRAGVARFDRANNDPSTVQEHNLASSPLDMPLLRHRSHCCCQL
jgi:hypothetical protein